MKRTVRTSDWLKCPKDHAVQLYDQDEDLIRNLSLYVGDGLRKGESCLVIATSAHRTQLETRLAAHTDLWEARRNGRYSAFDAETILGRFTVDGMPERELFNEVVGTLLRQAAPSGQSLRCYGEMVSLLWRDGNHRAALELEDYWNDLQQKLRFSLLCAYPSHLFDTQPVQRLMVHFRHDRGVGPIAAAV